MSKPELSNQSFSIRRPDVLIIDDDQSQTDELMPLVSSLGFNCVTAVSGLDGLAQIQQNPNIGIVLLDVFMPEINGLDVLKRLGNAYYRRRNLQCLLLTGSPQFDHVIEGLEQGAISFLIKPVTYIDLKSRLTKASIRYEELRGNSDIPLDQGFRERLTSLAEVLLQLRKIKANQNDEFVSGSVGLLQTLSSELGERIGEPQLGRPTDNKTNPDNMLTDFVSVAKLFSGVQAALENLNLGQETLRILVEIVVAQLKNQALPVGALCHAASIPQTTALRRIEELTRKGLIEKSADQKDGRRLLVTLTAQGVSRLSQVGALFR